MRVVYAYHGTSITFVYIEIYFKGHKENEDRQRIKEYLKKFAETQTALNRIPLAREVAKSCFFLASEEASAITGQSVIVDCGVFPQ